VVIVREAIIVKTINMDVVIDVYFFVHVVFVVLKSINITLVR